jgi:hypothetical protein
MTVTVPLRNTWSWLVTDLNGHGLTLLNRLATNLQITFTLNAPAEMQCELPSDNPEINIPHTDGDPFVSVNNRLLYGFRRELVTWPCWVCRFAGVVNILEDVASSDQPVTHLTAYDPWMWLNSIPVVDPTTGNLLGQNGLTYTGQTLDYIAKEVLNKGLARVISPPDNPSNPIFIDQTSGHFDTCATTNVNFPQGISVGEALTQLVDGGGIDIIFTPIYDPAGRPGMTSVFNIYSLAGQVRNGAIFGWDKYPHSLIGIDDVIDGTAMATVAQFYNGNVAVGAAPVRDAAAVAKYGEYWYQQSVPKVAGGDLYVQELALAKVYLRRKGLRTLTIDPASSEDRRQPDPFTEYYLGDQVMVYGGRVVKGGGVSLRKRVDAGTVAGSAGWTNPRRVYQIPLSLANDLTETVTQLLVTDANA